MNNPITLDQHSNRADRSKYLAYSSLSKGRHLISLREARCNAQMNTKDAAAEAAISERTLKKWEIDCGGAELMKFNRLCQVYRISFDHVYAGKEADLLEARREAETKNRPNASTLASAR